jgi:HEAT repeat protein
VRYAAEREAVRRGAKLRQALIRTLAWPHLDEKERDEGDGKDLVKDEPHPRARVAALSAVESLWDDSVRDGLLKVMRDPEATIRRMAFEALARNCKPGDRAATEAMLQQLEDRDPNARRALFLALGHIGGADAADGLVNTFKYDEGKDIVLTDGMLHGVERAGKAGIAKLVALAESGDEKDHDRVLDIFVGLRTRPAAEAIPGLLKYPHLTVRQRVDLLRSFGDFRLEPALSLDPVVDYLTANTDAPPTVKLAGLEVLSGSPSLRSEKGQKLVVSLFDDSDVRKSAVPALARRADGARLAAELLLAKKIPAELREPIADALRKHADKDKEAKRLLEEVQKGG